MEVTLCRSGVQRHDPRLPTHLAEAGAKCILVDCFDRCEHCERAVLARLDGIMTRFGTSKALLEAVAALQEEP